LEVRADGKGGEKKKRGKKGRKIADLDRPGWYRRVVPLRARAVLIQSGHEEKKKKRKRGAKKGKRFAGELLAKKKKPQLSYLPSQGPTSAEPGNGGREKKKKKKGKGERRKQRGRPFHPLVRYEAPGIAEGGLQEGPMQEEKKEGEKGKRPRSFCAETAETPSAFFDFC